MKQSDTAASQTALFAKLMNDWDVDAKLFSGFLDCTSSRCGMDVCRVGCRFAAKRRAAAFVKKAMKLFAGQQRALHEVRRSEVLQYETADLFGVRGSTLLRKYADDA